MDRVKKKRVGNILFHGQINITLTVRIIMLILVQNVDVNRKESVL